MIICKRPVPPDLQEAGHYRWWFAPGRPLQMIICKRPAPPDGTEGMEGSIRGPCGPKKGKVIDCFFFGLKCNPTLKVHINWVGWDELLALDRSSESILISHTSQKWFRRQRQAGIIWQEIDQGEPRNQLSAPAPVMTCDVCLRALIDWS